LFVGNFKKTNLDKKKLKKYLEYCKALEDTMKFIYSSTNQNQPSPFSNFKVFMRKYNDIAKRVIIEIHAYDIFEIYDMKKIPDWGNLVAGSQKNYFDLVLANLVLLRSYLENLLSIKKDEILNLENFFVSNLRKAVLTEPSNEKYVQDTVEQLLIGRGFSKGIDYDREVGRVKVSIKEVKPDFIFPKLNLALEVKLSKTKSKSKIIVDEINADISAYSKYYNQILFLIYDLGTIRDEDEFKNDIVNKENIKLVIIKH